MPEEGQRIQLPEHGTCFVCGTESPLAIGLRWFWDGAEVHADFRFDSRHQGPPGHAHGRALAAVADEAMGVAAWMQDHGCVAARLELDYRQPVPLGQPLSICARIEARGNRSLKAGAEIRVTGGPPAVTARGVFVRARHLFGAQPAWPQPS